jgi:hypothetical protein
MNLQNDTWRKPFEIPPHLVHHAVDNALSSINDPQAFQENLRNFFLAWLLQQVSRGGQKVWVVYLNQESIQRGWGEVLSEIRSLLPHFKLAMNHAKPTRVTLVPTHTMQPGLVTYDIIFDVETNLVRGYRGGVLVESLVALCVKGLLSDDPLDLVYSSTGNRASSLTLKDIGGQVIASVPRESLFAETYGRHNAWSLMSMTSP